MNRDQTLIVLAGLPVLLLTLAALHAVEGNQFPQLLPSMAPWRIASLSAAFAALPLLFAVWRIALFRFVSEDDRPGAGLAPPPGAPLRRHIAVLQNTLEQTVLAAIGYFAFAASAPAHQLALLPLFAALFVAGRTAFALGYRFGAPGRAFGFGLTMAPTATLYVLAGLAILR